MEFATGALGTLLPKLGQLLQDEYSLQTGVKKDIKFLKEELQSIQAGLRDVGEVPPKQLSEVIKVWARDVREVSYDMEDIVDTFLVRIQDPAKFPSRRSTKKFIKKMMGFVTKAKTRHDIGQEIKDIKERVKEIAERRDRYQVDAITPVKTIDVDPRITHLYTKVADLVGIDDSRDELITRLTKGDGMSLHKQRIVSVVGFGGLGKTTLAKVVYDRLNGQFDHMAFIPVGRNPNLKKVLMDILIDLDKKFKVDILDEKQLIDKIRELLKNKRYFIVIDDVWDKQSWESIKPALVENNNGCRIIITTRKPEVVEEDGKVYKIKPLSHENSRKLFFARIFRGKGNSSYHQPDDEVSGKLLKKCEGIPLAIITMASLLAGKPWEEWSEVYRSIGFANKENEQVKNTEKIISYSYYDLPSHLRTCLLYLSVFPEDHFIEKSPLVRMWIAEGFVHQGRGMSPLEIAEGYFNELVNRSMIQEVDGSPYIHESSGCRVHDMVLDLICSISREENFVTILYNNEGASSSSQVRVVRRLALQNNATWEAPMKEMRQVRSIFSCGFDLGKGPQLSRFKLIRVLNIYHIEYGRLKHILSLHHLRYFKLVGGVNVELPEEIGTLKCLQTLDVGGFLVGKVATSVCLLGRQLLCLRLGSSIKILFTDGISKMTSLEELRICFGYDARKSEEEELKRFVKELGSLRKLRVLHISCIHPWSTEVQINLVECLRNLEKMEVLSLAALPGTVDTATWDAAGLLLPRRLRQLFLHYIIFSRFPLVCINPERLPYLSHLCLHLENIDEQDLRIPGGLPELRYLWLRVQSTLEVTCKTDEELQVCNSSCTTDAAGDGYLFKELRRCSLRYQELRLLPVKEDSSGGVSFRMKFAEATVLLDSEWEGVSRGEGLVSTMIPLTHKLEFTVVSVRDFIDENHGGSLCLEYFASLQNIRVDIYRHSGSAAEVEEVKAALQHAADVHPNRPKLHIETYNMGEQNDVSATQDEEVQEPGTSEGN